ncbi:MAG: hypothetical protein HZA15_15465 [Nitrospirae bacterium]|nr:hypothetical protein [Nitrospirota bacterium]
MATDNKVLDLSFPADEDLSNDQFRIVVLDATSAKVRRPNAATDIPFGVLQNAPVADEAAVVRPIGGGVSKIQLGATIGIGVIVGMEYVDAADAGKAQAAIATQYPVGVLLAGGVEDDLGEILMTPLTIKDVSA